MILSSELQGDDPFARGRFSGLMLDLDTRIERNDEGLISAYTNLYRFGENDQQTLSTIEALKVADNDIMRYILQVIGPQFLLDSPYKREKTWSQTSGSVKRFCLAHGLYICFTNSTTYN